MVIKNINGFLIRKDLSNKRFGKLLVIKPIKKYGIHSAIWECLCDCGRIINYSGRQIVQYNSCLCDFENKKRKHLVNKNFGNWVLKTVAFLYNGNVYWWAHCLTCNTLKVVEEQNIISYASKNCQCGKTHRTTDAAFNAAYNNRKKSALFEFLLTKDEFLEIVKKPCHYCGYFTNRKIKSKSIKIMANGIDRLNHLLPYTKENSVPCCKFCNRAKCDEPGEFKLWIDHLKQKGFKNE